MFSHLPTVALIKMGISSLLAATIELAKSGILSPAISYIHLKVIKMLSIPWHLMFHMGTILVI